MKEEGCLCDSRLYERQFMAALKCMATPGRHANVLQQGPLMFHT